MSIQWSLVLFTALTGMAGWMFACVAIDCFVKKAQGANFIASIVAFVLAAVGGLASVTHLSHPENILGALSHPTSGIFVEAVLTGIFCVSVLLFIILLKKESEGGMKVFAIIGAIDGVALSFMAGESYMMSSQTTWNTILLPLSYFATAIPAGIGAYLVCAYAKKAEGLKLYATLLAAGAAIGAIVAAIYVLTSGNITGVAVTYFAIILVCMVIAFVIGFMLMKKESGLGLAIAAMVCAFGGAVALRCLMWIISLPTSNFFGNVL